jgi:U3 small nucleolar RNA-associated protein 10
MQLQVDGLSPKDPVAVMPCLTALQSLQPVFFENLKTDTKVFVCVMIFEVILAFSFQIVHLVILQLI